MANVPTTQLTPEVIIREVVGNAELVPGGPMKTVRVPVENVATQVAQIAGVQDVIDAEAALAARVTALEGVTAGDQFPLPTSTVYVNPTAGVLNGIPAGNDTTGNGTAAAPWATLSKALATVPAGGLIRLCGTAASPQTYSIASNWTISSAVAIDAMEPFGAIITSTGTVRTILLSANLALGRVILDAASTASRCIEISTTTAVITVVLAGTRLRNFTEYGVFGVGGGTRVRLTIDKAEFTSASTIARSAVSISPLVAGGVFSASGYTVTLSAHGVAGQGAGYQITGDATTAPEATVRIENLVVRSTLAATASGTAAFGLFYGGRTVGIRNILILAPDIEIDTSAASGKQGVGIGHFPAQTSSTDSSGFVFSGRSTANGRTGRIYVNSPAGGYGVLADPMGAVPAYGFANNGSVQFLTIEASAASKAAGFIAVRTGVKANTIIAYNRIINGQILDIDGDGARVFCNVITGAALPGLRLNGSLNSKWQHNTVQLDPGYAGSLCCHVSASTATAANSSGWTVQGNLFVAPDATSSPSFALVDAAQGNGLANNHYYTLSTLDSTAWSIAGTGYATFAAYQAAEPTATWGEPLFYGATAGDFRLQFGSLAGGRVTPIAGVAVDHKGAAFASLAAAGAFEVGA